MSFALNRRTKLALTACLAVLLLALHPKTTHAQIVPSTASNAQAVQPQIPLSRLYLHFFLYEAHLEHLALAHPIANPRGKPVKEHLRIKTGLSETEWQAIAATSLRIESAHRALAAQAQTLMAADRQACKPSPATCAPPNFPQLKALQKQDKQALDAEIDTLESSLGPASTAKLRTYLQTSLANNIQIKSIPAAQSQNVRTVGQ